MLQLHSCSMLQISYLLILEIRREADGWKRWAGWNGWVREWMGDTLCNCMKTFLSSSIKDLNFHHLGPKCHDLCSEINPDTNINEYT